MCTFFLLSDSHLSSAEGLRAQTAFRARRPAIGVAGWAGCATGSACTACLMSAAVSTAIFKKKALPAASATPASAPADLARLTATSTALAPCDRSAASCEGSVRPGAGLKPVQWRRTCRGNGRTRQGRHTALASQGRRRMSQHMRSLSTHVQLLPMLDALPPQHP
jgi:hypothetical protein